MPLITPFMGPSDIVSPKSDTVVFGNDNFSPGFAIFPPQSRPEKTVFSRVIAADLPKDWLGTGSRVDRDRNGIDITSLFWEVRAMVKKLKRVAGLFEIF